MTISAFSECFLSLALNVHIQEQMDLFLHYLFKNLFVLAVVSTLVVSVQLLWSEKVLLGFNSWKLLRSFECQVCF